MKILFYLGFIFTLFSCKSNDSHNLAPTPGQKAMIDRKYGMFLHYGMNTYLEVEWSDGKTPAGTYAPPSDIAAKAAMWVSNAKQAGMRSVVLITKHHDGFCLWDSKFTDYDIAHPDVINQVDIVKAVSDACKKENIAFSIYYSLWDRHEPSYKDEDPYRYIIYMKNQLGELMTNYGKVAELWFDGAWDRNVDDWYLQEIYDYVKELQPECQISTNHTIGKRPIDMQYCDTIKYFPSDFRLWDPFLPMANDNKIYTYEGKQYYLPYESTQTISVLGNWFSNPNDSTVRDLEELKEIFYVSTLNDNCLLLNIPPDKSGVQKSVYIERINALADYLGIRDGAPFPVSLSFPYSLTNMSKASATSTYNNDTLHFGAQYAIDSDVSTYWQGDSVSSLVISLPRISELDEISLIIGKGSILSYNLECMNCGNWKMFYDGTINVATEPESFMNYGFINVPIKPMIKTDSLRINIKASNGKPQIYSIRCKNSRVKN